MNQNSVLRELFTRFPVLRSCREDIEKSINLIVDCYHNGGKVMICGNGGSATDSEHIVGELMKGFMHKRGLDGGQKHTIIEKCPENGRYLAEHLQGALPTISLISQTALLQALANDVAFDMVFAQQVYGYAKPGDVLIAMSTSGNSQNVVNAAQIAGVLGVRTVAMTGCDGGELKTNSDITIAVPELETYRVQELHLPIYHAICMAVERDFFPTTD